MESKNSSSNSALNGSGEILTEIRQVSRDLLEEREVIGHLWNKLEELQTQFNSRWDQWIKSNELLHLAIKELTQFVVAITMELSNNGERMLKSTEAILELRRQLEKSESLLESLDKNLQSSNKLIDNLTSSYENWGKVPVPRREKVVGAGRSRNGATSPSGAIAPMWSAKVLLALTGAQLLLFGGWVVWQLLSLGKVPTQYPHVRLSQEDIALLMWAKSTEGQRAKNLLSWNSGLLVDCTKEVQKMGIRLEVRGRKAVYGFCPLWVVPPQERRFEE